MVRDKVALSAVAVGVVAVSASAVFIRLAEAPAISIAIWRNLLGVFILLPFAFYRRELIPKGRVLWVGVASGVALGAHFGFWISSLDYTSVAASVVLVSTQPVFVAVLAYLLLRERTTLISFAGILVAVIGTVLIVGDTSFGAAAPLGNALALLGALTVAGYVLMGRSMRTGGVGVLPYAVVVYTSAAMSLVPVALIMKVPLWGYSQETWFWLWAIAIGPQILGHTVFNWALKYLEASVVSGVILAEIVGSTILAWLILGERPGLQTLIGAAVVLGGLGLLIRGRRVTVEPVA